uniref:Actin-like protein arp6 n=1 Tax=Arundo donax TaxID=35708 RepID=A0A0A9AMB6_ARUDO
MSLMPLCLESRMPMYTNAINALLLCLAQSSVFGEVDLFWRPALTLNQCALQNQSMRRWDQHGAGKGFFH